ncbi:MAG: TIGR01244 family sulfur transferase [Erythrobacter sp.]|uniref:TIGR01244 family sulfur transferase n=1 Tax=Erythrobacter sp. TaxID=1042 RepID=UPI00326657C3
MPDFKPLSETVFASPQIELPDVAFAKTSGVTTIVNNRPDGEEPSAPQSQAIEAEALAAGLDYISIPIGHSGFSEVQVDAMVEAMKGAKGSMLAYCRSGTRSTFLWALASAKMGANPDAITQAALAAGFDVSPVRPMMDMLATR